jgi:hypothetical protein
MAKMVNLSKNFFYKLNKYPHLKRKNRKTTKILLKSVEFLIMVLSRGRIRNVRRV